MTEPYLLPISSATSTNHADANGTPSGYSHGIFRQPNRPYLSAGYRNDMSPTPHLHSHPQQLSRMVPYPPSHPQLHNISYGPPQPMRNATYTQMPALANASHRHTNVHPTSLDVQRYQRHPGSTPPAGTYLHQSGVAFPPSQRPEPQHLPPCGSSTQPYPLPQGHVLPHNHPAPLPQYPAAPSRQIHGVLMPHQPYPQVTQVRGHQRVPPPHYTSAPLQYNIQQDQNDPPYVPPRAPESVQSDRKNKRKVSDSKEPVPRNSKIQKVPPPQSPILFKKRRGPGRPTKAETEARKKALKEQAATTPSDASSSRASSRQEPSTSNAPRQASNPSPTIPGIRPIPFRFDIKQESPQLFPTPRQTNAPGNPQTSIKNPQPATSAKTPPPSPSRLSTVPSESWSMDLPFFDDFINEHASGVIPLVDDSQQRPKTAPPDTPTDPNCNGFMPPLLILSQEIPDLAKFPPPINGPYWPSKNHMMLPPLGSTFDDFNVEENVKEIVDGLIADGFLPAYAQRLREEDDMEGVVAESQAQSTSEMNQLSLPHTPSTTTAESGDELFEDSVNPGAFTNE